jgi:hypothetical protein
VTQAVFQVFEREGELATLFDPTMYEHYLAGTVTVLAKTAPHEALTRFCNLLLDASRVDRRLRGVKEEDYTYYTVGSLEPDQASGHDIHGTLILAIVKLASTAVQADRSSVSRILEELQRHKARIFRRIGLHVLALAPGEAPNLAGAYLGDGHFIDAEWCRQEYAELAKAWFPHLPCDRQEKILRLIDSVPQEFLETWRVGFERYEKRKPNDEDERKFRECTIRDIVWGWRDALPAGRRAALDKTVAEFGDPDSWRARYLANNQSSLSRASMQSQSVAETIAYLDAWRPDPHLQTHTAGALANELREAAAAKPEAFSSSAAGFSRLRPLFIRQFLNGMRQTTANGGKIDWEQCLALAAATLERSEVAPDGAVPGDDPDWSWALRSTIEWLASALRRGAEGIAFVHAPAVHLLVLGLYRRTVQLPPAKEDDRSDFKHPFFAARQTVRGAAVELCLLLLFWLSKDPASSVGKAPREALARTPEIRAIFETELRDRSQSGRVPRAVLGRYLTWLFYFGQEWVGEQLTNLFPADSKELRDAAWFAHIQSDQSPVADLVGALHSLCAEHIAALANHDASTGRAESDNRLAEYLIILYLWDKLPEDLLQQFWDEAPAPLRRHAMWFIGRHLSPDNGLQARAMSYWDRRLQLAVQARDPEPYRRELGTIGQWFLWKVDPLWLMDQLLVMLNAGFAPNDGIGVIDNLANQVPEKIDKVVEITKALVRQPNVEAWIFASQDQSLRKILTESKKSEAPMTVASVREIVSCLSSRGNPSFLDLDE